MPLAEEYYNTSSYAYTLNNPIIYIDPDGNQVEMCCDGLLKFIKSAGKGASEYAGKVGDFVKSEVKGLAKHIALQKPLQNLQSTIVAQSYLEKPLSKT